VRPNARSPQQRRPTPRFRPLSAVPAHRTAPLPFPLLLQAFKIVPALSNWQDVLALTQPWDWSPHSTFAATRLFASNLDARRAQIFYSDVLLPKCREDIAENKKLNYHLYAALKKAIYKPDAFYKGVLLPLAASGTCTLAEATVRERRRCRCCCCY